MITDVRLRDHMPIMLQFTAPSFVHHVCAQSLHGGWDWNRLADAVQKGIGKRDFLQEIEAETVSRCEKLGQHKEENYVDDHWAEILDIAQPIAKTHFSKKKRDVDPQHAADIEQRLKILKIRAALREQLGALEDQTQQEHLQLRKQCLTNCVNDLSNRLQRIRRQQFRARENRLLIELFEAWRSRAFSDCHRIVKLIAAKGRGPRKRVYFIHPTQKPTVERWKTALGKPGKEGGLGATQLEWNTELIAHFDGMPDLGVHDLNCEMRAKRDMAVIRN
jgi:hypothetical protein